MLTSRFCSRVDMSGTRPVRRGRSERVAGSHVPVCKGHSLRGAFLSIRLINAVIADTQTKGGERLLLICMARYASDEGTRVFPSVETLAKDTQQDRRAVQRQLRALSVKGLIRAVGVSRHNTINYVIAVDKLPTGATDVRPPGATVDPQRGDFRSNRGDRRPPDSSSNTSINRQQHLETPHVKSPVGDDALNEIAKFLPQFKRTITKENP